MQYRASFVFSALGQFLVTGIEIIGVWALFERFGGLAQWTLPQVAMFYGVGIAPLPLLMHCRVVLISSA